MFFGGKDLVELENRNFVIAIGLDKSKKRRFRITIKKGYNKFNIRRKKKINK